MVSPIAMPKYDALWKAWAPLTQSEKDQIQAFNQAGEKADALDGKLSDLKVEDDSAIPLSVRMDLTTKLDIYRDLVNFYAQDEKGEDRFGKLLSELKGAGMRGFDLELRVKRANEGKEAANRKYKDKNWFGAMYTYAVAWGCIVPYYSASLADNDPLKKEIEKLELALFSNISAMALSGSEDSKIKHDDKAKLLHLGLRASVYCLNRADLATAGIVSKSCRRAADLAEKLKSRHTIQAAQPAQIVRWKAQEEALKGVDVGKAFQSVEAVKKSVGKEEEKVGGWEVYEKKGRK